MKEIKHLLIVRIVFLNDDLDLTRKGLASRKTAPKSISNMSLFYG